jgi:hypothetical protein
MSDAEAQAHIGTLLQPSADAGGFCFSSGEFTAAKEGRLVQNGSELRFRAVYVKSGDWNSRPVATGIHVSRTDTSAVGDFVLDLTRVETIRLVNVSRDNRVCQQQKGRGTIAILETADKLSVIINVRDKKVNELMASLVHLSPGVRLAVGRGI